MIKIVICDDLKDDLDRVHEFVKAYVDERKMQAEIKVFNHPDKLLCECEQYRAHIYILDIVMPMVNGIQVARELRWNQPDAQIVFATSEKSFALESFDVNPINYIVKPVERTKLFETLDLAVKRLDLDAEKSFTVKIKAGFCTVNLSDVMYIDYRNHVVSYHLYSKEVISTPTLRIGFAEYLSKNHPESEFVQCHESVCVNISAVDVLTKTDITVRNKELIPVSKSRYQTVAERYLAYRFD